MDLPGYLFFRKEVSGMSMGSKLGAVAAAIAVMMGSMGAAGAYEWRDAKLTRPIAKPGFRITVPPTWTEKTAAEKGGIKLVAVADASGLDGLVLEGPKALPPGLTAAKYFASRKQDPSVKELAMATISGRDAVFASTFLKLGPYPVYVTQYTIFQGREAYVLTLRCSSAQVKMAAGRMLMMASSLRFTR
jgi:hypothetical protein